MKHRFKSKIKNQKLKILAILFFIVGCANQPILKNQNQDLVFLPVPRQLKFVSGFFNSPTNSENVIVEINPKKIQKSQGYCLEISPNKIHITAHDKPGAFYAEMTLRQIFRQSPSGKIPCLTINDYPDFQNRGIMLDISRDKVPTMQTLYNLVDKFAELKINQFQLYTEHTFAYKNHKKVWENASPMTASQIQKLDVFCKNRFIELVPNQNSFGHFERWLKYPEYKKLAEVPAASVSLNPENPDSIKLIEELYSELLPNFSSKQFNVGCDETMQLGKGASSNAVAKLGKGKVYLNFLRKINKQVQKNGKTMQFWGDIVSKHPELISELPENVIALVWGYRITAPYAERTKKYADAGVPFYVCPGTAAWNSLLGRTDNMLSNVFIAAKNGLENGAKGLMICEWGDHGHWQHLPFAYPGFAYAAAVSWDFKKNHNIDLEKGLDSHIFLDKTKTIGKVICELGETYNIVGNLGFLPVVIRFLYYPDDDINADYMKSISVKKMQNAIAKINCLITELDNVKMDCKDADWIIEEFKNNAALAKHSYNIGIAKLETQSSKISEIPIERRKLLADELENIIPEYRRLWLRRNRPGGLKDSTQYFENLLQVYCKEFPKA